MPRVPTDPGRQRALSTARAVLRVLSYLADHPAGVTPAEVAQHLGKSPHTAYYLLNSLCQEGFAYRSPADGRHYVSAFREDLLSPVRPSGSCPLPVLRDALRDLNRATGCRAYLVVYDGQAALVEAVQGHQGQPGLRMGREIRGEAHALAVGKILLAHLSDTALHTYIRLLGLRGFTPRTITDPERLRAELARVRRTGLAVDREEYQEGICCLAAPVLARDGGETVAGAMGIAVTPRRFQVEGRRLAGILRKVVFQTIGPSGGEVA
ncbi:IclR family transcriptional regulator [Caldinitratiruptor microaerophilus]|uniref:IclR family transcriptional regulator n=1 Tax=Caldinitratiruptor microaerophilus TaxID=671077 RepID=A0AA35G610_9FIRM|nr:IclR family transcriptional regulator [Caldinitratiruptor microaerophilus]BDG60511.1 hypothetical protein caldi_16010 [Caldinitratiruptor microaerophilus]